MRLWITSLFFLFLLWFAGFFVFIGYINSFSIPTHSDYDAVVVFTGRINREVPGFNIFKASKAKRLLISGVDKGVKVKKLLPFKDIENYPIDLGYEAHNTYTNALETAEWMHHHNFKSICLITNRYHMPRSLLHLRYALDKDAIIIPYPLTPPALWWKDPLSFGFVVVEYHKCMLAQLMHWLR